jgi:hypothetical protein
LARVFTLFFLTGVGAVEAAGAGADSEVLGIGMTVGSGFVLAAMVTGGSGAGALATSGVFSREIVLARNATTLTPPIPTATSNAIAANNLPRPRLGTDD